MRAFFATYTKACLCPKFENDAHLALWRSVRINLRTRQIDSTDYTGSTNTPILHRKEMFVAPEQSTACAARPADCPGGKKQGLLDVPSVIGTQDGWAKRFAESGFVLKGHRLVRKG